MMSATLQYDAYQVGFRHIPYKPKIFTFDKVATSKIHALSPSYHAGALISHPFLNQPWEFGTSGHKDGLMQLGV
jgi:hypothetical protein